MAEVRNISSGPRGAYLKGELVMVDPGKTAKADDWNEEWFAPADQTADDSDLSGLDLMGLVNAGIEAGLFPPIEQLREELAQRITAARHLKERDGTDETEGEDDDVAEPGPLDQSVAALTEHLASVTDVAEIDALIAAETGGKSRVGALAALEARKVELTDAG